MDDEVKASLLYEWNTARGRLDFAIAEAESQLVSVNKRLQGLWHDLAVYSGILVLPWPLYFFLQYVQAWFPLDYSYIIYVIVIVPVRTVLACVYVLTFPIWVFHLIKAIVLLVLNRENPERTEGLFPPEKGKVHKELEREATYRIEQQKLIHVLSRYYLYRDNMKLFREKIDEGSITLNCLKQELKQFTYYETIHPASEFAGLMGQKTRTRVFIILFGIIGIILFLCSPK